MSEPARPPPFSSMPASGPRVAAPSGLEPSISEVPPSAAIGPESLERLLVLSCALPVSAGVDAVARAFVDALAEIVPDHAVGLCVAASPAEGGQKVICRVPGGAGSGGGPDPSRLFSAFAHERILAIDADPAGSTLHCASDSPALADDASPIARLLDRASLVLSSSLRSTRALAQATRASTELRGLQAQVIQSEKLASLGQIAAGVVHELNNPLTSIIAYSDHLRKKAEREGGDPTDLERLRRIAEAADRILRFSRDLVAYARPSNEVPAPVAIHEVIDQALVFCEHVLAASSVEVVRTFGSPIVPVRGVPGQLTQVFVNLVTNACHAMDPSGGQLSIKTEIAAPLDIVRVTVTDTGHGIDHELLGRIFEPFFTTKTEGRGTGLGLSIVRNIIALHGGTIAAESHAGAGTSFVVELPVAARPESEPP